MSEKVIEIDKEMAQDIAYAMGVLCATPTVANPERCKEIGEYIEQALLRAKPPAQSISDIAIPCPDECGGILEVKQFTDRPTCNECGKVFVLCLEQSPAGELEKAAERIKNLVDSAIVIVEQLESGNKELEAKVDKYKTVMQRCIKSMSGSHCDELLWLEEALKGE